MPLLYRGGVGGYSRIFRGVSGSLLHLSVGKIYVCSHKKISLSNLHGVNRERGREIIDVSSMVEFERDRF